jgi:hypothetical protein
MSKSIGWILPNEIIELAIASQVRLTGPLAVMGAMFDSIGEQVIICLDVEDDDVDAFLNEDLEVYEFDEGEFIQ